jgi:TetR/AcrR family transcriptional regulator of autoinduction and epiphytic fitness
MSKSPLKLTDRKRAAIIEAAVSVFQQQGFALSSMDKIAAVAGVSKRTVYNHFASKELLFDEILQQMWERASQEVDYSYHQHESLDLQLERILTTKVEGLSDPNYQNLSRVVIAEMIHSPQLAEHVVSMMSGMEKHLNKWLQQAVDDKRIECEDLSFAAEQLHGLLKCFCFWPQVTLGKSSLSQCETKRVIQKNVAMFLKFYRCD